MRDITLHAQHRLIGRQLDAIEHRNPGARQFRHTGSIQYGGHAGQVTGQRIAFCPVHQVVDRQHGVRLAAAERRLQLDDRVATFARQTLHHGIEQQTHALGDEGALEKQRRILVLRRRRAIVDTRQICGELGLLESALQHIFMRNGDFAPGFEGVHVGIPWGLKWMPC